MHDFYITALMFLTGHGASSELGQHSACGLLASQALMMHLIGKCAISAWSWVLAIFTTSRGYLTIYIFEMDTSSFMEVVGKLACLKSKDLPRLSDSLVENQTYHPMLDLISPYNNAWMFELLLNHHLETVSPSPNYRIL